MELCGYKFSPIFLYIVLAGVVVLSIMGFYSNSIPLRNPPFQLLPLAIDEESGSNVTGQRPPNTRNILVGSEEGYAQNSSKPAAKPLLTIFTTFKNAPDRFQIHTNVLMNWVQFMPQVQPILYAFQTDKRLVEKAKELGWIVLPVPRMSTNKVPFFKDMYLKAKETVDSTFYGYANGDLLFDNGLVDTLTIVDLYLEQLHQTLVVGIRSNYQIKNQVLYKPKEVGQIGRAKGKLFRVDAEDYFFIAHNTFPWKKVPDIVIGRPAYDNYLVGFAIMNSVSVVDSTKTMMCLHQSGIDGDYAGHKNKDKSYNLRAVGRFDFSRGHTTSAQYLTMYNGSNIELWARKTKTSTQHHLALQIKTTVSPTEVTTVKTTTAAPTTKITTTTKTTTTKVPTSTKNTENAEKVDTEIDSSKSSDKS